MNRIIGIDLGTTNSTLAYTGGSEELEILQFEINQQISENTLAPKQSLPSFYFFPLQEDQKPSLGFYAKERGEELPDRVISSAKSWLCHDMIDRRAKFLPLGELENKLSPVDVCTAFLTHLKERFEEKITDIPFNFHSLLITVPASFDPGARLLVQEAAELAGFSDVRLIEEPLAAFYSWLYQHRENWRAILKVGDTVLVVDIGGGTTDFSLISVLESDGELSLERKAVGSHLLLGGDNIDLALAHFVSSRFSTPLDEWQFQSLVHVCRNAKEQLLSETSPETLDVTIQGRGSRLIGGALSVTLKREEIEQVLVDGFFPFTAINEPLQKEKKTGIAKLGLPYARDPRITVQLARFLSHSNCPLPTAVLFNGGTMKAKAFQNRIVSLLSDWAQKEVKVLPGADLDFGVSRGAVYYGWTRTSKAIRVRAGTSRSYYIGVESALPAVPGVALPIKKIQIVPFGMEEGTELTLENEEFTLVLEEPAVFRFFCQNSSGSPELTELHPIETVLHAQGEEGKVVLVKLTAKVTELGMLELWCVADDGRKWKLEFDIRKNRPLA